MIEFYKEATGVRGIKSTDEVTGEVTERLGIMDFESYKKSLPMVIKSKVLYNKLKDPEFKKFYDADSGKKNELITFEEWKPLALVHD